MLFEIIQSNLCANKHIDKALSHFDEYGRNMNITRSNHHLACRLGVDFAGLL